MGFETHTTICFHEQHLTEEVKTLILDSLIYHKDELEKDDIDIEDSIATFSEYSVRHGEFAELEDYFKEKEIPFDRYSEDEEGIMWHYAYRPHEFEGKMPLTTYYEDPFITVPDLVKLINSSMNLKEDLEKLIEQKYPPLSPLV